MVGSVRLGELARVADLVSNPDGRVEFELAFFRDDARRACVRGHVVADLKVRCQRCLDDINIPVDARTLLAIVAGDAEAEQLPDEYDPVLVDADGLDPRELVEDELLLALPQVPMHDPTDCDPKVIARLTEENSDALGDGPFGILAQLKNQIH